MYDFLTMCCLLQSLIMTIFNDGISLEKMFKKGICLAHIYFVIESLIVHLRSNFPMLATK